MRHFSQRLVRSTAEVVPQSLSAVIDNRGRLAWWRNRDLLAAFGLPSIAAWTVFVALAGFAGVLHIFGGVGRGWFFLVFSACGLAAIVSRGRLARGFARVATSEHARPMRWLLLREPHAGEAYLVLYKADGDPTRLRRCFCGSPRSSTPGASPRRASRTFTVCSVPSPCSFRGSTARLCGPEMP